jgi:hypothetical protein
MSQINVFDDLQPGYYGSTGAGIISDVVLNRLGKDIRGREELFDSLKFCGGVTGYVSSVVVPEVGLLLIMEDLPGISKAEAKRIMRDSVAYGAAMNAGRDSDGDGSDSDSDNGFSGSG